jgi:hypothetical protein
VVLISAYEMGDYINGSEASGPFAGPLVGMICAGVVAFAIAVVVMLFETRPLTEFGFTLVMGAIVAVLCPLSQMAASLCLPRANAFAPAFRRLDSYLLTGPVWLWLLWTLV